MNEFLTRVPAYLEASNIYDYLVSPVTHISYTIHRRTLCIINRIRIQTTHLKLKFKYFSKSILNRLVANNINKSVMGSGLHFSFLI
jgi:hypothetical protein